ncbi:FtsL-like putative cell division protein [Robertkochia flava]|uniref:FtsL-like putative cell division protein n=1 Tax=Robertkochia flava TaxID=3447986 RepID=UPI001CCDDAED|nr:FtsL-like putative cell division protein [Robertkochia marina]
MRQRLLDVLRGSFLTSDDAAGNWRFILFASLLAVIMISSAHRADKKVHQLAGLNEEVLELRSEFVDVRTRLQQRKLESSVKQRVEKYGLAPSKTPPKKIKVASQE